MFRIDNVIVLLLCAALAGAALAATGDDADAPPAPATASALGTEPTAPASGMQALLDEGVAAWHRSDYPTALDWFEQGLAAADGVGDPVWEASFTNGIGVILREVGRYQEALGYYERALDIRRVIGDRAGEGSSLTNIGDLYRNLGRYSEAMDYFQKALAIRREIGDLRGQANDLGNIALVYYEFGRHDRALEHHGKALSLHREIGDRRDEAKDLGNIGLAYESLGRHQDALANHAEALAIARELGDRNLEGGQLLNIGRLSQALGRHDDALMQFNLALAIAREIGGRPGEAIVLGNLGDVYRILGRYQDALQHHSQGLVIRREIGDRAGEADALNDIGLIYFLLLRDRPAMEHFSEALAINREIGDRSGEARDLGNMANLSRNAGRYQEALERYAEVLAIHRELGESDGEAVGLTNMGNVYMHLGRHHEALARSREALVIHSRLGNRSAQSATLLNIGAIQHGLGALNAEGDAYRQALIVQAQLREPDLQWRIWDHLRRLWQDKSHFAAAILAGKRAVNRIQAMRALSTELERSAQQSFLEDKEGIYRTLADLLITEDRPAEAQQILDMLKEQEFYDYLRDEEAHDPRTTRAALIEPEAAWIARFDAAAKPLMDLGVRIKMLESIAAEARSANEHAELDRLIAERDAANAELDQMLVQLPACFVGIDADRVEDAAQSLADAPGNKRALLAALSEQSGQPTGLLQFILLEDKVRLLLTTPAGWHTAVVEVDGETLATEIDALRTALTDSGSDAATPAKALYTRLVAPIVDAIDAAGLQSLLVHLDGKLRYIPFAALHDGEQWLAERWSLVYYTAASERQPEAAGGGDWRVAGLGVSEPRGKFIQLPAVAQEIDGIVREDDSDPKGVLPGRALLNTAFSETALRTEAADPANRILHLASHFDLHPGSDADSSLLLGTVTDDGEPHTLSLKALRESKPPLDLRHIDLVTLSACNTFMGGADDTGVEIEGMGTIIQRQGARGVLASLWPVADASTGVLMQTFYRLRAERPDLTKAQALQQAQLGLLRGEQAPEAASGCAGDRRPIDVGGGDGSPGAAAQAVADAACGWRHPFYWAPFVLMGNWL
jgi:CHAT domain-containing protein